MKGTKTFIMMPKVDFCFKELMADETVRKGFIGALLQVDPEKIKESVLLPAYLEREYSDDKLGILDVRVRLYDGTQINVEIQISPFMLWPERSTFYLSKMYSGQIKSGDAYQELKKCIHVGILNFVLFKDDKSFYSRFHLREDSRGTLYTDKLEIHILELPKLGKYDYPENELLDWAQFINAEQQEELMIMSEKNKYLGEAYEKLVTISADEKKRLEYEARQKAMLDHNYLMGASREEGRKEGIRALVIAYIEDGMSKERTIDKLKRLFNLDENTAKQYYESFSAECEVEEPDSK